VKLALRALLVLVVAGLATQVGAAAPAPRMHITPYSAFFWTPQDGLLGVEMCASRKYMCGSGAVELTTDGGRTYHVIFRTPRPVYAVQAIGRRGALAWVAHRATYRTVDRGRHWTAVRIPSGASFSTPRIGLGFRKVYQPSNARLLRTGDAGRTWKRVRTPRTCSTEFPLLDLVTPQLGWMLCGGPGGAGPFESKAVFRTRDGGRTWQLLTSTQADGRAPHGGISPAGLPAGISFARGGFGVIWGNGVLDVTRDGGKTWKAHPRLAEYNVDFDIGGSAFQDGTARVLVQLSGPSWRLVETRDFGRSWHLVRSWAR